MMKSLACQVLLSLQLPWMIAAFTSISVPRIRTAIAPLQSTIQSKWTMMPDEPAPEVTYLIHSRRKLFFLAPSLAHNDVSCFLS
jgi:hypothetical protein